MGSTLAVHPGRCLRHRRTTGVEHAARYGVLIASGQQFCAVDGDHPNIRIPFTSSLEDLAEGMRRLSDAWRTFDRQRVSSTVI